MFALLIVSISNAIAEKNEPHWRSIPLTTAPQAKAGITGGEGFQQVMCITYAPSNPLIVYMGSDTTQVWKSSDSGRSWYVASNGFDANGACSLLVHPKNEDIVIAAGCLGPEVERAHHSRNRKEGIFRTIDGGNNWTFNHRTEFHKQQSMGSLFAVDLRTIHKKEITLFAGSHNDGLLISIDTGLSWKKTNFSNGTITDIETTIAKPGLLIIATTKGLYQYHDGNIKKIGQGLNNPPSNIAISPDSPERVFAAVGNDGIYISNDLGKSFNKSSDGLPPTILAKTVDVFTSPVDASQLYAGTWKSKIKGPFFSNDAGENWKKSVSINAKKLTTGKGFWFPSPIATHPEKAHVALTASNGRTRILRTNNGGQTWFYSNSGYTGGRVVDIAFLSPRKWYLALTDHGLWKTENNGITFTNINIPGIHPRSIGAVAAKGKDIILSIGSWKNKKLVISNDSGENWRKVNKVSGRLKFIRRHPQNQDIIYASDYRSDDNGQNWIKLKHKIRALLQNNGDVVYGFNNKTGNIIESSDRGNTWHTLAHCAIKDINEMASDPNVRGRLYLASNTGIYTINNKTCTRVDQKSGFLKDTHGTMSVKSIAVNPQKTNMIYAGRWAPGKGVSTGIFLSRDYGKTWGPLNKNITGNFNVWSIQLEPSKTTVYIGSTYGLQVLEQVKK